MYNYAVSGAVCSNEIIYRYLASVYGPFPDVIYEVNAFVADTKYINASTHTNTLYKNRRSDNTVYSMWIGTNDLGADAFLTDSGLNMTTIPDYVDCIYDRFDEIYKAGGRYFVLMNTAPLQLSPLYGMPGQGGLAASHYWPDKVGRIPSFRIQLLRKETASKHLRSLGQNERVHQTRQRHLRLPHAVRTPHREAVSRSLHRNLRRKLLHDPHNQQPRRILSLTRKRYGTVLPLRCSNGKYLYESDGDWAEPLLLVR